MRGTTTLRSPCLAALYAALATTPVFAQTQPWANPYGSVNSTVMSCAAPTPLNLIALDDFRFGEPRTLTWVRWWGNVSSNAQRSRKYYIAIWSSTIGAICAPACHQDMVLQTWCVNPTSVLAGMDCNGRNVYRFTAGLAPGFNAAGGVKYWLQISEDDSDSVQVGTQDFRWSGYRPNQLCPAQQISNFGVITCNINDDCVPPVATDLSYVLRSACMGGVIVMPSGITPGPACFLLEFRTTGALPNSPPQYITELWPDEGGSFLTDDIPADGNYDLTLRGMAIRPTMATTMISNGIATPVTFNVPAVGDLDNNTMLNGFDISYLVAGLLMP